MMITSFVKYIKKHNGEVNVLNADFGNSLGTGNPSIVSHNGRIYMTFRQCEYTFMNFRKNPINKYCSSWYPLIMYSEVPANYYSYNQIAEYIPETHSIKPIKKLELDDEKRDLTFNGAEDLRLFIDSNENVCASYSVFEKDKVSMNIAVFDNNFNVIGHTKYANPNEWEKNWMPVMDNSQRLVRKAFDNIITYEKDEYLGKTDYIFKCDGDPKAELKRLGSTQMIPYKDNFICIIHQKDAVKEFGVNALSYQHKFIITDKKFNIIKESQWFTFFGFPIEFTCGMTIVDDDLLLPFAVWDSASYMIKMKMEDVLNFIDGDNCEPSTYDDLKEASLDMLDKLKHNYAVRIAGKTFLGLIANDAPTATNYYIDALYDVKGFKVNMYNAYTHALIGEDLIIEELKKINCK